MRDKVMSRMRPRRLDSWRSLSAFGLLLLAQIVSSQRSVACVMRLKGNNSQPTITVSRNGIYTVIAPKVLRPNSDYHVAVSIHDAPDPVFVTVEIEGIQDAGGRIHSRKQQQIDSGETRILQFPVSCSHTSPRTSFCVG